MNLAIVLFFVKACLYLALTYVLFYFLMLSVPTVKV